MSRPIESDIAAHGEFVRSVARKLLLRDDLAEDVVQQTWLALLTRPPRGCVRAWLGAVVYKLSLKHLRTSARAFRREQAAARMDRTDHGPSEHAEQAELFDSLTAAILDLPDPFRRVMFLRFYKHLRVSEIALDQRVSEVTVRKRLNRGLGLVRHRLDGEYGGRSCWVVAAASLVDSGRPAPATEVPESAFANSVAVGLPLPAVAWLLLLGLAGTVGFWLLPDRYSLVEDRHQAADSEAHSRPLEDPSTAMDSNPNSKSETPGRPEVTSTVEPGRAEESERSDEFDPEVDRTGQVMFYVDHPRNGGRSTVWWKPIEGWPDSDASALTQVNTGVDHESVAVSPQNDALVVVMSGVAEDLPNFHLYISIGDVAKPSDLRAPAIIERVNGDGSHADHYPTFTGRGDLVFVSDRGGGPDIYLAARRQGIPIGPSAWSDVRCLDLAKRVPDCIAISGLKFLRLREGVPALLFAVHTKEGFCLHASIGHYGSSSGWDWSDPVPLWDLAGHGLRCAVLDQANGSVWVERNQGGVRSIERLDVH